MLYIITIFKAALKGNKYTTDHSFAMEKAVIKSNLSQTFLWILLKIFSSCYISPHHKLSNYVSPRLPLSEISGDDCYFSSYYIYI